MKKEWKKCIRWGLTALGVLLIVNNIESVKNAWLVLRGAAAPVIFGGVIAYLINIPMSFYEQRLFPKKIPARVERLRRPLCMLAALLTVAAVLILLWILVIPELTSCITLLIRALPGVMEKAGEYILNSKYLTNILSQDFLSQISSINWNELIARGADLLFTGFGDFANSLTRAATGVFSVVTTFVIGLIFSLYILLGKERVTGQIRRLCGIYIPEKWSARGHKVIETLNSSFHSFIVGQCIEAVLLGTLCMVGMLIFRFPYAAMIGALIGFTALIPVAGAYIGAGAGALMIMTVSPMKALLFLVFIVVLQQLEGNIIYPRVVGSSIGLPGIWTFAAIIVGGGLLGIYGMLLGVPIVAAIYKLTRENVRKVESERKSDEEADG